MSKKPSQISANAPHLVRLMLAAPLLVCCSGCFNREIATTYGVRGGDNSDSVNGTAVFAALFSSAGHRVTTVHRITPRLQAYDVIVWAPNNFQPPDQEQRIFFERWLAGGRRTLIYIGRDFDAAPLYWQLSASRVNPAQAIEMWHRRATALADFQQERAPYLDAEFARWFTTHGKDRSISTVSSITANEPGWLDGINTSSLEISLGINLGPAAKSDIPKGSASSTLVAQQLLQNPMASFTYQEVQRQSELPANADVILQTDRGPLLTRVKDTPWQQSQILIVSNGSFLLNLPLHNVEHRKLAGKLVAACGSPSAVAFLETDVSDEVSFGDDMQEMSTGLEVFKIWPLGIILLQVLVVGIVACFAVSPVFGRPRENVPDKHGDFGKHIEALGKLLQRTRDEIYARDQIQQYYRQVRGDAEQHAEPAHAKTVQE